MRTSIFLLVFLVVISSFGCAGTRTAKLSPATDGTVSWEDTNLSLFQGSVSPGEMAAAYAAMRGADLRKAMAERLASGVVVKAPEGKKFIGFVNNDPKTPVYTWHPELPGLKIHLSAGGGWQVIETAGIPPVFVLYKEDGTKMAEVDTSKDVKPTKGQVLIGGIAVDHQITINSIP